MTQITYTCQICNIETTFKNHSQQPGIGLGIICPHCNTRYVLELTLYDISANHHYMPNCLISDQQYTSLCVGKRSNTQIDYFGTSETVIQRFAQYCEIRSLLWARLFHVETGYLLASYSSTSGLLRYDGE